MRGGSYRILLPISFSYTSSGTEEARLCTNRLYLHLQLRKSTCYLVAIQFQYGAGLLQDQIKFKYRMAHRASNSLPVEEEPHD